MYGYLRIISTRKNNKIAKRLKRYYCATCLALRKNYGLLSTLVLSYDLVIVPVILGVIDESVEKDSKCYLFSNANQEEIWKPIAAMNLAIAEQKIMDAYEDESKKSKKFKYKLAHFVLYPALKKAKNDYEGIFVAACDGMEKICEVENNDYDLMNQGKAFADMILSIMHDFVPLNQAQCDFLTGIAMWLCFMDALDDYEKDYLYNRYNPLFVDEVDQSLPIHTYVSNNYMQITEVLDSILSYFSKRFEEINDKTSNEIMYYVRTIIPSQTKGLLDKLSTVENKNFFKRVNEYCRLLVESMMSYFS